MTETTKPRTSTFLPTYRAASESSITGRSSANVATKQIKRLKIANKARTIEPVSGSACSTHENLRCRPDRLHSSAFPCPTRNLLSPVKTLKVHRTGCIKNPALFVRTPRLGTHRNRAFAGIIALFNSLAAWAASDGPRHRFGLSPSGLPAPGTRRRLSRMRMLVLKAFIFPTSFIAEIPR